MLRNVFVITIILIGAAASFYGPFNALLFYLWNAYFRPEVWVWDPFISQLNLSFSIGFFLLAISIPALLHFRLGWQVVLVILFFAQSVVSLLVAENFDWSWQWWTDFAKVVIITLLITVHVTDRKRYRMVLLVIAFSLGLESAKQGWAQMILNPGAANNNALPMFGDNNFVAVGMMMLLPIFIALARTARTPWERALHWFFIIGVVYRGVSTYSRGGFLAMCAMGLLALWQSPRRIRSIIGLAVVIAIVAPVMPQAFWNRMKTITAAEEDLDESQEGRLYVWRVAKVMADRKPFTGVGFNGYQRSYRNYNPIEGEFGYRRSVHSAWYGVLAEMGYPGLLLLVAIIVVGLMSAWRIRLATRGDPELADIRIYASAVQMSLVAYIVGMTFLHGQYLEMFWHVIGLGVALQRIHAALAEAAPVKAQARPAPVSALGAYQQS